MVLLGRQGFGLCRSRKGSVSGVRRHEHQRTFTLRAIAAARGCRPIEASSTRGRHQLGKRQRIAKPRSRTSVCDNELCWLGVRDDFRNWCLHNAAWTCFRVVSEHVQIMADDRFAAIELTNLLQQRLLGIRATDATGVCAVVQNQQTRSRLCCDLRHLA